MKKLLLLASLFMSITTFAQSDYEVSKDKENDAVVFKGQITFADLNKEKTFTWMKGAASYKTTADEMDFLRKHLPRYDLVILMGTWCDDSQNLIPKLYKVLQQSGYPMDKLKMYGVDRAKQAKYIEHKLYGLEKVPTIIVIKDHSEVGRIVESVKETIETELIELIMKDQDHK